MPSLLYNTVTKALLYCRNHKALLTSIVPPVFDSLVIYIGNDNQARDDNFEVSLNGTVIGAIDLSVGGVVSGGLWRTNPAINSVDGFLGNAGLNRFDIGVELFTATGNMLTMRNVQNNDNSNFGRVSVCSVSPTGAPGVYSVDTNYLEAYYSGVSGLDFSFGPFSIN